MKLWDKGYKVDSLIERFTVGKDVEMDYSLAEFDVLGSLAHIHMLESIHLLEKDELTVLTNELRNIYKEIKNGDFVIEDGVEDVHSQVEMLLIQRLGDVGKKIHSGRSRNDQVLVDLKLFTRNELKLIVEKVESLYRTLVAQSEKYKEVLMPGYTHFQVAMPSSFGLWFGAYAESLIDDLLLVQAAYRVADQNPLGSAAGYGSSFPLNRQMTTDLLGFDTMNYNVVYAQMGRGKTEKVVAFALASVAATLAKLAMDVCLYMSQNFNFVSLPKELTTGSSIMPHKKNPDVFELLRSHCNKIQALPNQITLMVNNLPSGYFRDLQLVKEVFIPAFAELNDCLDIANFAIANLEVNQSILDDERYKYMYSVEEVNRRVLSGVPFRDAYREVGEEINRGEFQPDMAVNHTHEGSIGNLCLNEIDQKMEEVLKGFSFEKVELAFQKLLGQ
ncbi:argininosuccinate lyase [Prolixibacter denitrificans]|uniref:Argininosuccinate lyase n=1 Tax=Prolixibacter denitrificans TaxID=1541063 RepID=A0A2P8CJU5_9BACT|nr:argininosuccinate lyase [Prolixibacter denitrificans]PSK85231.1 argininosuccinate lyase [Prolixibacter denitrificans]GET19853.1 argininosuccinate lyase [Prolixibacter denitrificans]